MGRVRQRRNSFSSGSSYSKVTQNLFLQALPTTVSKRPLFAADWSIVDRSIRGISALLLTLSALGCSIPSRSHLDSVEFRRIHLDKRECDDCATVDLSAFEPFGTEEVVEGSVAYRIARSELLSLSVWRRDDDRTIKWCASALLTDPGARRAPEFAVDPSTDPLEDALAVSINGVFVEIVLRGELRAGPSLGCFESAEKARRALNPLGPKLIENDA